MSTNAAQTAHLVTTGATVGVGAIEWLTMNSSAITALCVIATTITAIGFGFWNAKSNSDRNKVNRRDIIEGLIDELKRNGKSESYIEDLIYILKK